MEITGIEPVVPEGGGFTVHCITIDASSPNSLVASGGLEPPTHALSRRCSTPELTGHIYHIETHSAFEIPTPWAKVVSIALPMRFYMVLCRGIEPLLAD